MDVIVTEAGVVQHSYRGRRAEPAAADFDPAEGAGYASSPCSLHELDPVHLGYMSTAETIALLNELLEGERAGRSEEHTSELQSLMRISYSVFCLKKKTHQKLRLTD